MPPQISNRNTAGGLLTEKAMVAIRWLASRCDWATSNDGAGFSSVDAPIGHALAEKPQWSQREMLLACELVVKYKKQLEKGRIDVGGIDAQVLKLKSKLASKDSETKLKRRDIVQGKILVNESAQRILIKTEYHEQVVAACRELLGSNWDKEEKLWSAALCAENAQAVEDMANQWGFSLRKHAGWGSLVAARKVERVGERLHIHGVRAWAIIKELPKMVGKPDQDELIFDAFEVVDDNTLAIPLRSWIIREALLWFVSLERDSIIWKRMGWAHEIVMEHLQSAYADALLAERKRFTQASATSFGEHQITSMRSVLPVGVADRLLPHQWVAVDALVEQKQVILADQQGLGKTIEILVALEAVQAFPVVVLVPKTALLNWRDEAVSWLPHRRVAVLSGDVGKRDKGVLVEQAEIAIINYDSFGKHAAALEGLRPKALIADEAQYLKGHDSARTKAVKEFCKITRVERIILASGTPVMNRPAELLTLLTLLPTVLAALGGFKRFASRYCRAVYISFEGGYWDYGREGNLGELANRLRESGCFIRREKRDVLPGLANKVIHTVAVEITTRDEHDLAAEDFKKWLKTQNRPKSKKYPARRRGEDDAALSGALHWVGREDNAYDIEGDCRAEALKRIIALRMINARGKIAAAIDWIIQNVKDEKLVVFAYHIEVQQAIIQGLEASGVSSLSITGDMSAVARRKAIQQFQTDPASRLIVCSLMAAQTAITLTAARRALMVELDWTPSVLEQAEDRIHRIGQHAQVEITYLHAANTLDERMSEIILGKRAKINVIGAGGAPYGFRKDGAPRLQAPGPGRPPLPPDERAMRRKNSKASWQAQNAEYMRDYMQKVRLKKKIKQAEKDIRAFEQLMRLGHDGVLSEMRVNRYLYPLEYFEKELAEAEKRAAKAKGFLAGVKDIKQS